MFYFFVAALLALDPSGWSGLRSWSQSEKNSRSKAGSRPNKAGQKLKNLNMHGSLGRKKAARRAVLPNQWRVASPRSRELRIRLPTYHTHYISFQTCLPSDLHNMNDALLTETWFKAIVSALRNRNRYSSELPPPDFSLNVGAQETASYSENGYIWIPLLSSKFLFKMNVALPQRSDSLPLFLIY